MTNLFELYVNLIDSGLRSFDALLYRLLGRYVRRLRFGPLELELRGSSSRRYSEVLQRLRKAEVHFAEALEALDDLKLQYLNEKAKVFSLRRDIESARREQETAVGELETTKDLLAKDKKALKAALGLDDRRSRFVGFVSGVIASIVAGGMFQLAPIAWAWFKEFVSR